MTREGGLRATAWLARGGTGYPLTAGLQGLSVVPPGEMGCGHSAEPPPGGSQVLFGFMLTQMWGGVPATLQLPLSLKPPPTP